VCPDILPIYTMASQSSLPSISLILGTVNDSIETAQVFITLNSTTYEFDESLRSDGELHIEFQDDDGEDHQLTFTIDDYADGRDISVQFEYDIIDMDVLYIEYDDIGVPLE